MKRPYAHSKYQWHVNMTLSHKDNLPAALEAIFALQLHVDCSFNNYLCVCITLQELMESGFISISLNTS